MSKRKKSKSRKRNPKNLYQRNDTWWIRYHAGGQVIRRSLGTSSLREAKRLRDEILAKRTAAARFGIEPERVRPSKTFGEIATMWVRTREADTSLAPSTRYNHSRITRQILVVEFGPMAMSAITVEDLERFIAKLRPRYAPATVALYVRLLNTIIRHAIRRGWHAGMNPFDRLDRRPSAGPRRDTVLTVDESKCLLAELSGSLFYRSALALQTGLRWGEVHGLAWEDMQLEPEPSLTICRSYQGKTKTKASAATIPLSRHAVALLLRWRADQPPSSPWIFPRRDGSRFSHFNLAERRKLHAAVQRAGIDKHITPHVFRHTFGTRIYEHTGDPKIVQRLMRHARFSTSMAYVHDHRSLTPFLEKLPSLEPPANEDRKEAQKEHSDLSESTQEPEIPDDSDPSSKSLKDLGVATLAGKKLLQRGANVGIALAL